MNCFRFSESSLVVSGQGNQQSMTHFAQNDDVTLVPVHKEDFRKINEFAEAAWICRDPDNVENIKEKRRDLLNKVIFYILQKFSLSFFTAQCQNH